MKLHRELEFYINAWSAWSPQRINSSDWIDWAAKKKTSLAFKEPSVAPDIKRRRMSNLSKMSIFTALESLKDTSLKPICVFASRYGELTRTLKLLNALVDNEDLSPTDFSMSVHNTALGLFSIESANELPSSMVSAGENTFEYGLLESCAYLTKFPKHPLLYVYSDESVPAIFSEHVQQDETISIALLLSSQSNDQIKFDFFSKAGETDQTINSAEAFLEFFLSGANDLQINKAGMNWQWRRGC